MSLFKKINHADERVTSLKNKIYAELFILITIICAISLVVKSFFFNTQTINIVTELVILIVSGVYYIYRSVKLGVVSAEIEMHDAKSKWPQRKKNLFYSILFGVIFAFGFGLNSAIQYGEGVGQSIWYFIMVTFVSLMIYLPVFLIIFVIGNDALKKKSDDSVTKILDGDRDEKH